MKINELYLIEKSKRGDINAFEKLIKDYKKIAYNIAFKVLGNVQDAEDMSQEALIKVFRSIKDFNMKSTFKVWMYRIVVNTCIDFKRKKVVDIVSIDEELDMGKSENIHREITDNSNNPDIVFQRNHTMKIINNALDKMDEDFKMIIILRDIQGFSYAEISEILSCNLGTVKSRLNRARKSLKDMIENEI